MTQDIGSDAHKRPPEVKMAIMEERLREARERDRVIISQLDTLLAKVSKVETGMAVGEREFAALKTAQQETTDRLDIIEDESKEALKLAARRDPVSFWTSIGAAGTAIAGILYAFFHGPPPGAP